jgi:hypothetical protein
VAKKTFYYVVRLPVFILATIAAAVLVAAALGVLFTAMRWSTLSPVLAAGSVAGLAALIVAAVWATRKRRARITGTPAPGAGFWFGAVLLIGVATAGGWGMSMFFVTPPLTVYCLEPLGAAAVPAVVTSLEESEARPQNDDFLDRYPDAVAAELPRLEAAVREDRPYARQAIEQMAKLGPRAAPAVPLLLEELKQRIAKIEGPLYLSRFDSTGMPYEPWIVLMKIGDPAVPAVADALARTVDERERFVLACILRQYGAAAAPAAPILLTQLQAMAADDGRPSPEAHFAALGAIRPASAPTVLQFAKWAQDRQHRFSRFAVSALGSIGVAFNGTADNVAVTTIATVLNENPLDFREDGFSEHGAPGKTRAAAAIDSLGRMGTDAAPAAPRLAEIARTEEQLDWAAVRALACIGPNGVEELKKLLADGHASAVAEAINHVGLKAPDLVPALRGALEQAKTPDDRFHLAWALYRNEPNDDLLKTMAEAIEARDPLRDSPGMLAENGVFEELDKLGPRAAVFAPVLKQLIERTSLRAKVKLIKTLARIEPGSDAPLDLIVREMRSDTTYPDDVFDAPWLTTIDPTGEKLIPVMVERLDDDRQRDHAVRVLIAYGPKARSTLPAVVAANDREPLGEKPFDIFLWNNSPTAFIRHAYLVRYLAIPVLMVVCLLVECIWFRWRLSSRTTAETAPRTDA